MSWLTQKLGDVLTLKRGYDLPSSKRQFGSIPIISSSGITGTHNICKVEGPGVVTGRYGTIGKVYYVNNDFWPLNTALYVQDFKGNDPRFVSYFLSHVLMFTQSDKAAVPGVNRNDLHAKDVLFPPKEIHTKIASILTAYDDLIENNNRRIALLEDSARQLYREWFVRLRFPGHENTRITDGVPDGWEKAAVSNFCTVGRGASPRPIKDYMGGDIPWFKIGDATASESPYIFETVEKVTEDGSQKSIILPVGELILSNSATCGIPNFTGVSGCIHDGWLYFKGLKHISKYFLYLYLIFQQQALLQGIGDGATQKNLNTKYVSNQPLLVPKSTKLLVRFDKLVQPKFDYIENLAKQNQKLKAARDLLLPKLMNGEIPV